MFLVVVQRVRSSECELARVARSSLPAPSSPRVRPTGWLREKRALGGINHNLERQRVSMDDATDSRPAGARGLRPASRRPRKAVQDAAQSSCTGQGAASLAVTRRTCLSTDAQSSSMCPHGVCLAFHLSFGAPRVFFRWRWSAFFGQSCPSSSSSSASSSSLVVRLSSGVGRPPMAACVRGSSHGHWESEPVRWLQASDLGVGIAQGPAAPLHSALADSAPPSHNRPREPLRGGKQLSKKGQEGSKAGLPTSDGDRRPRVETSEQDADH